MDSGAPRVASAVIDAGGGRFKGGSSSSSSSGGNSCSGNAEVWSGSNTNINSAANNSSCSSSSTPSPASVGREFVRQYYTLLNSFPQHLHRFYSTNSSYIHGGLSENSSSKGGGGGGASVPSSQPSIVMGQRAIHEKIMALNFVDCHAKIRQVDAHATLEEGVVIQVSGELSNAGGPMRRFMQTFVLAPQSPKKYYVHNDIFRYQDEVFSDEDNEVGGGGSEVINSSVCGGGGGAAPSSGESVLTNNNVSVAVVSTASVLPNPPQDPSSSINKSMSGKRVLLATEEVAEVSSSAEAAVNGATNSEPEVTTTTTASAPPVGSNNALPDVTSSSGSLETPVTTEASSSSQQPEDEEEASEAGSSSSATPATAPSVNNGPLTYAKLVKSGPASGVSSPVTPVNPSGSGSGGGGPKLKPIVSPGVDSGPKEPGGKITGGPTTSFRGSRGGSLGRGGRERYSSRGESSTEERSSPRLSSGPSGGPFSDAQQLFVGNLPHNVSVGDLHALFGKFGKVLEIRINGRGASLTKTNSSGARVPNYGFVVFEEETSVSECLKKKPIYLPERDHRLNIEEKKVNKGRSDDLRSSGGNLSIPGGRGGFDPSSGSTGSSSGPSTGGGGGGGSSGSNHSSSSALPSGGPSSSLNSTSGSGRSGGGDILPPRGLQGNLRSGGRLNSNSGPRGGRIYSPSSPRGPPSTGQMSSRSGGYAPRRS